MTVSAKVLFTSPVTQTGTDFPWAGTLDNILVDSTSDINCAIYDMGTGDKSKVLNMSGPKFLGSVPINAVISDIAIDYRALRGYGVDNLDSKLQIGSGTVKTGTFASAGYTTHTVSGTIASWGLTNAEAMQFVMGTLPFKFYFIAIANGPLAFQDNFLQWIKAQVTWSVPAGVHLPQVF